MITRYEPSRIEPGLDEDKNGSFVGYVDAAVLLAAIEVALAELGSGSAVTQGQAMRAARQLRRALYYVTCE